MKTPQDRLHVILLATLVGILLCIGLASTNWSCQATGKTLADIEALTPDQMTIIETHVDVIARAGVERLIVDGKLSNETALKAAQIIANVAVDPIAGAGPSLITAALKQAGFTDSEALIVVLLVEDFLRSQFTWGKEGEILGPHARHLLDVLATSIRAAATVPVPVSVSPAMTR